MVIELRVVLVLVAAVTVNSAVRCGKLKPMRPRYRLPSRSSGIVLAASTFPSLGLREV